MGKQLRPVDRSRGRDSSRRLGLGFCGRAGGEVVPALRPKGVPKGVSKGGGGDIKEIARLIEKQHINNQSAAL